FEAFGLDPQRPVLGLFPGSRRSEIKRLLPTVLQSAELVQQKMPQVQFILPRASTLSDEFLAPYLAQSELEITVVPGRRSYDVMRACDTIISASGTATLEIALMQVPLVVLYKIAPLSYRIISRLLKVEHIALCNIVAGERVAPELIQHDATAEQISREALSLLADAEKSAAMRERLGKIREKLGGSGGSANVAALALELLQG
ncbi:MAG TPA: lipid-A-disaccharide synthase, partial [Gammaproteobacteria bacterium]